jgi:endoglycosylceramidase
VLPNDGFTPTTSLSVEDAEILQSWGFNVVRLGVMWPGVEPKKKEYSDAYLEEVSILVSQLADRGIYVILDLHQDLWHREYCGEGVPDYLQEDCTTGSPSNTIFAMPKILM